MSRDRKVTYAFRAVYVVIAFCLMSPLLSTGVRHSTVWPEGDASLAIWANGFVAHFWTWNASPLFSSSIFAPHGLNLLANTTSIGLALLLTPITSIFGPIASFNAELFILPVAAAISMEWALRRTIPSPVARGVAGLVWGFSSYAMEALYMGWPNFLYLITPPILFWVSSELLHGEVSVQRLGIITGLTMSIQVLIGGEIAAMCLVVMVVVVVIFVVLSLARRRWPGSLTPRRLGRFIGWASVTGAPIGIPAVLYTLKGPAHLQSWVWPKGFFYYSMPWSVMWTHPVSSGPVLPGWVPVTPSHAYFGPFLLIVALLSVILVRRGLSAVALGLAILGLWLVRGPSAPLHTFDLMVNLPVIHNIIVQRFVLAIWFAVALAVAVGLDGLATHLQKRSWPELRSLGLLCVVAISVLTPTVVAVSGAGVWHSQTPRVDNGLTWVAQHEPATPVVVTFPFYESSAAMIQQVAQVLPIRLLGGWGPQPGYDHEETRVSTHLALLSEVQMNQPTEVQLRRIFRFFKTHSVTDLVIPQHLSIPTDRGYRQPYQFAAAMAEIYGAPVVRGGDWYWNLRATSPKRKVLVLAENRWRHCAWGVGRINPHAVPGCILRAKP